SVPLLILLTFSLIYSHADTPPVHSFPTRRSSDLSRIRSRVSSSISITQAYSTEPFGRLDFGKKIPKPIMCSTALRSFRTGGSPRSEEHTSELQSRFDLVCRLLLEKKKTSSSNIIA